MKENDNSNAPADSSASPSFHDLLLKALIAKGRVGKDIMELDPEERKRRVKIEPTVSQAAKAIRNTANDHKAGPPVDCSKRLHLCNAICCKLGFALSQEEIDRGIVRWEPEKPFFIRHESDGHCCHIDRGSLHCTIYADRPRPCINYSCAGDPRIWADFEGMVLNTEWIEAALGEKNTEMDAESGPEVDRKN